MRSAAEWAFRAKQEVANLQLWLNPQSVSVAPTSPFPRLPNPERVAAGLRGTAFANEIEQLASLIIRHRISISGADIETGNRIEWRRDYRNHVTSGTPYFRFVPYLNFQRVGNSRTVWELNRHQHLVVLAQAFHLTHRDEFLQEIKWQIETWLADNPFMRGINWASALEVAFRALSWIWVYHLVGHLLPNQFRMILANALYRHGRYLEHNLSTYASPNTHLLGEAVSLHALAVFFSEFPRAAQWRSLGASTVSQQMKNQVREDGSHFEQSSYYHLYALDFFVLHVILEVTNAEFQSKLWRMADFLDGLMGRARILPLIGDDDGGRVFHPYGPCDRFGRATIATCARLFTESRWQYEETDLHEQGAWWLSPEVWTDSLSPPGARTSRLFNDSGLVLMASEYLQIVADAGPFGAGSGGHSHSDTLSVIARDGAEQILLDPGTYTYIEDAELRKWFRGSAAHNTVRIDGHDQALSAGPFRWDKKPTTRVLCWRTTSEYDMLDAVCRYDPVSESHAAIAGNLVHRRRLLLIKANGRTLQSDVLMICDQIEGPSGTHSVEQFWHPHEKLVRLTPASVKMGSRSSLMIPENGTFEFHSAWRSPRFGVKESANSLMVRFEGSLPLTMWAAVVTGRQAPSSLITNDAGNEATLSIADGPSVKIVLDTPDGVVFHLEDNAAHG